MRPPNPRTACCPLHPRPGTRKHVGSPGGTCGKSKHRGQAAVKCTCPVRSSNWIPVSDTERPELSQDFPRWMPGAEGPEHLERMDFPPPPLFMSPQTDRKTRQRQGAETWKTALQASQEHTVQLLISKPRASAGGSLGVCGSQKESMLLRTLGKLPRLHRFSACLLLVAF